MGTFVVGTPLRRGLWALWLMVGLLAQAPRGAAAAPARLMVISVHNRATGDFDGTVVKHVLQPLGEQLQLVPGAQAHQAVVKSGLQRPQLAALPNARRVGRLAGASHVLIVDGAGPGSRSIARARLLVVATGKLLWSSYVPLEAGQLSAHQAGRLVPPVLSRLGGGAPAVAAAPAPAAAPEAPAPAAAGGGDDGSQWSNEAPATDAPAPPQVAQAAARGKAKGKRDKPDKQAQPSDGASDEGEQGGGDGGTDGGEEDAEVAAGERAASGAPRARPPTRLAVGPAMMQRSGILGAADASRVARLPNYTGDASNTNPFFLVARLEGDLYPFAFAGKGRAIEGLGVRVEGMAGYVKSILQGKSSTTLIASTIGSLRGEVAYRWVWFDSATAPDVVLALGLQHFSFPLAQGQFPSVGYTSPTLGVSIDVPLGRTNVVLTVGGVMLAKVSASEQLRGRLSQSSTLSKGSGVLGHAGVRFSWHRLELGLVGRYEKTSTAFKGPTNLPDTSNNIQLNDATLADRFITLGINLGLRL